MYSTTYLHIGLEKTGSTSIQNALSTNREEFRRNYGVVYPETPYGNRHAFLTVAFASSDRSHDYKPLPNEFINDDGSLDWMAILGGSEADCAGEIILLSDETLSSRVIHTTQMVQLRESLLAVSKEIKVVCFLGNPATYVASLFQQAVKAGWPFSFSRWIDEFTYIDLNWERLLKPWVNVFGSENVLIRYVEDGSSVEQFITILEEDTGLAVAKGLIQSAPLFKYLTVIKSKSGSWRCTDLVLMSHSTLVL